MQTQQSGQEQTDRVIFARPAAYRPRIDPIKAKVTRNVGTQCDLLRPSPDTTSRPSRATSTTPHHDSSGTQHHHYYHHYHPQSTTGSVSTPDLFGPWNQLFRQQQQALASMGNPFAHLLSFPPPVPPQPSFVPVSQQHSSGASSHSRESRSNSSENVDDAIVAASQYADSVSLALGLPVRRDRRPTLPTRPRRATATPTSSTTTRRRDDHDPFAAVARFNEKLMAANDEFHRQTHHLQRVLCESQNRVRQVNEQAKSRWGDSKRFVSELP